MRKRLKDVRMKFSRNLIVLLCFVTLVGATIVSCIQFSYGDFNVAAERAIVVTTDDSQYVLREKVTVGGTVSLEGSLASDILVSLEIIDPKAATLIYRTCPIGNPNETWVLEITEINIHDFYGNPLDTVKIGNTVLFSAKVANPMPITRDSVLITLSIVDGNQIPIRTFSYETSIGPESYAKPHVAIRIPEWAYSGKAFIYVNVYDRYPSQGGVPYLPEKSAEFYISRTSQGVSGSLPLKTQTYNSSSTIGYESVFRLSPAPEPGDYTIYANGRYDPLFRVLNTTTFEVLDAAYPPQASFTFTPLEPYPNQTVTFDASSSTAEGYGDAIISYEWDFGDGNITTVTTPTVTHRFMATRQYIVTLNVTDTEGLWSTTQKPITTQPTDPTAAFTWDPLTPRINTTITFNATASLPGWSISTASPAPIVSYTWNFGDSIANYTVDNNPYIDHIYDTPGNFTVTLTVVDSENQKNTIIHIVEVANVTSPIWDINGDGKVNIEDLAIVAIAFGSYPGDPNWNPEADLNNDGKVNIEDLALVGIHFGEIY